MKARHFASWMILALLLAVPGSYASESCSSVSRSEGPEIYTEPVPASAVLPDVEQPQIASHGSDLIVSRYMASYRTYVQWRYFYAGSCAQREGCVAAPGWRKLLRFWTRTTNQGAENFHLGSPTDPANRDHAEYDSCHGHYHMKDWASYELLSSTGSTVVRGRKQAFCLMDSAWVSGWNRRRYHCGFQGITSGWADDYADTLDCQWIDVTGVPAGSYILQIKVNPVRRYLEANYTNNTVQVPVRIY